MKVPLLFLPFLILIGLLPLSAKPNFILILADDLGYGDVGFNGSTKVQTPNLDRLAKHGLVMTDFHSNGSVCSPTRAALLTGRYQHRSGVVNVLGQTGAAMQRIRPEDPFLGLELDEVLIPELLKPHGYATAVFGKWHLGPLETHGPNAQGFDTFVGCEGLAYNDFTYVYNGINRLYRGDQQPAPGEGGQYFTYKLADEACAFIDAHKEEPFFIYMPLTAPHIPQWGPDDGDLVWDEKNRFGPRDDPQAAYYDVIAAIDKAVGQVIEVVEAAGIVEETFIIFTSDNGAIDFGSPEPWAGRKSNLYEGGTRVPTVFYWPGTIEAGSSDALTATMDVLPTYLSLAGIEPETELKLDGLDLSALFMDGGDFAGHPMLFWEKPHGVQMFKFDWRRFAVREGTWKLMDDGTEKLNLALFDLSADPRERHDVSDQYPERVEAMHAAFVKWKADVYADAPYDLETVIAELKEANIIKPR